MPRSCSNITHDSVREAFFACHNDIISARDSFLSAENAEGRAAALASMVKLLVSLLPIVILDSAFNNTLIVSRAN